MPRLPGDREVEQVVIPRADKGKAGVLVFTESFRTMLANNDISTNAPACGRLFMGAPMRGCLLTEGVSLSSDRGAA